ncbi:MAG: SpoIIIAH-like family protein [Clostridia bacterium]|nr:SpoIIIAH-like family protein [Clostridia bacterium]
MSKIKLPKLKFHTRTIIAGAFVLLICAAAYTDSKLNGDEISASAEYLYTAGTENENQNAKILGEAAFVDSIMSPDENGRVGESISTEASSDESAQASTYDTYFSAMQVDRQKSRREACEILQTVVDSADSMPDVKERAYEEMMAIAGNIEIENNVSMMVKAKGFEDCIAVINGDNLNIVVKTNGLLTNEVAQIKEIAVNETGFAPENIKIVEKSR